jgi:hypothetical protein
VGLAGEAHCLPRRRPGPRARYHRWRGSGYKEHLTRDMIVMATPDHKGVML